MSEFILHVKNLTKDFDSVKALNNIDVTVEEGTIHGLIGPNGSGKTTFFNVVTGLLTATSGQINVAGRDITGLKAHEIAAMGVRRTFQNGMVVPTMTCLQNVMVGAHQEKGANILETFFRMPFTQSTSEKHIADKSRAMLEFVGLSSSEAKWAGDLVWVERQLLQIARALVFRPKLLLLDEPTSGMGGEETGRVKKIIEQILNTGITIMLVSHDVDLVMDISTTITAISYGDKLCTGTPSQVKSNEKVLEAYLGS